MGEWFAETSSHVFEAFSTSHKVMLGVAAAGIAFLAAIRKRLSRKTKESDALRMTLLLLLIASEVTYQAWTASAGIWNFRDHMPLHLCAVASLAAVAALVTWKKTFIQIAFFLGLIPPSMALFTPLLPFGYRHYRFWKFFIHHMAIPWACLFLAFSEPAAISLTGLVKSYGFLFTYAVFVGQVINPMTGANYLFLSRRPSVKTPLDFLGKGKIFYVNLAVVSLAVFVSQFMLWSKLVIANTGESLSLLRGALHRVSPETEVAEPAA